MWVPNLGSRPQQVYKYQQLGMWTRIGETTEVVAALSEGEDPDREAQVKSCLKSAMGLDLPSEAKVQILGDLQPCVGLFHLPGEARGTL